MKWDLLNVAVLGLEKCMKSLGLVLMEDKQIIKSRYCLMGRKAAAHLRKYCG